MTLRLSAKSLRKAKSLGKGYTAVLSRILEDALNDNEVIFESHGDRDGGSKCVPTGSNRFV